LGYSVPLTLTQHEVDVANKQNQAQKAELFRALHHEPELLILPNIWNPMGARLLEGLGYPAVATASAAVAYSLGLPDGEVLSFDTMLEVVGAIAAAVEVPVTADLEAGYADTPEGVAENIRQALRAGIVGVNLEDTDHDTDSLYPITEQQKRLQAVCAMVEEEGVSLVVNARTDVFLHGGPEPDSDKVTETIRRAAAYLEAGADCIYPITLSDLDALKRIHRETGAPLNVYATASVPPIAELEAAGISRLSLGPGLLKASLTVMKGVAEELLARGSYEAFTRDVISNEDIQRYIFRDPE
jgi:2-methylisocitrate lyase-like PEP mutase family enzyme